MTWFTDNNLIYDPELYDRRIADTLDFGWEYQSKPPVIPPQAPEPYTYQPPVGGIGSYNTNNPYIGGLLGDYGQMSSLQGGNVHNALRSAMTGNTGQLSGLLSPGTATQRPGRLSYTHTGE